MNHTDNGTTAPPGGRLSGSARFFLIQPANLLLGLSIIHLLPDQYFGIVSAKLAMSAGIFGASFGFGSYSRGVADSWPWRRALATLAILDALGLMVGYVVALLASLAGVTEQTSWALIPLFFIPWILIDFATPFVANRIVGPIAATSDDIEKARP